MTIYNDQMIPHDGSTDVHFYYPLYPHQPSLSPTSPPADYYGNSPGNDHPTMVKDYESNITNNHWSRSVDFPACSVSGLLPVPLPLGPKATKLKKEVARIQDLAKDAVARISNVQQQLNVVSTEINRLAIDRASFLMQKAESAVDSERYNHNQLIAIARIEELMGVCGGTSSREYQLLNENAELLQKILLKERLSMGIVSKRAQAASTCMQDLTLKEAELRKELEKLREEVATLNFLQNIMTGDTETASKPKVEGYKISTLACCDI